MGKIKPDVQRYRPIVNNGHPDLSPDSVAYQEYWAKEIDRSDMREWDKPNESEVL